MYHGANVVLLCKVGSLVWCVLHLVHEHVDDVFVPTFEHKVPDTLVLFVV